MESVIRFQEVFELVRNLRPILPLMGDEFAAEFKRRTREIMAAILEENGWTSKEAEIIFSGPETAFAVVLREKSHVLLEKLLAWMEENPFSIHG